MAELPPKDPPDEKKGTVLTLIPGQGKVETPNARKLKARTEEYLMKRPRMKAIRDRFISEYIRDWNGPQAYIRAGGPATTATKMAWEFLNEPYVSQKIQELIEAMEEEKLLDNKTIIMGLIQNARFHGIGASHSARVAAWMGLAKIKGLEKTVVKGDVQHTVRGGVMVVPVVPGTDAWEQLASGQQKLLKEDVRK